MKKDNNTTLQFSSDEIIKNEAAMKYMLAKLELVNSELSLELDRKVASNITGRVKSIDSIVNKLRRKKVEVTPENAAEKVSDVVGVRVVCFFVDDLYKFERSLSKHQDIIVKRIKDYVRQPKSSGYRSLHMICTLLMPFNDKTEEVTVEVQLRTNAMDYWAELDNQLSYKKENAKGGQMVNKLKAYADEIEAIDKKMMKLRDKINEL